MTTDLTTDGTTDGTTGMTAEITHDDEAPELRLAQTDEHAVDHETDAGEPELACQSLEEFVSTVFAPGYSRRITGQFRWCAQWWRHVEAVLRLEALWRSWEALRLDHMLGMATWHRDYLDHQLLVLTGPSGPFADCQPDRHCEPEQHRLPVQPAPIGWLDRPTSPGARTAGRPS